MRNPADDRKDMMLDILRQCGLTNDQLVMAEQYINGETDQCDLKVGNVLPMGWNDPLTERVMKCFERLGRHDEEQYAIRFFELCFQIFGMNSSFVFFRNTTLLKNVDEIKKDTLEVVTHYGDRNFYANNSLDKRDKEKLYKTWKYIQKEGTLPKLALLSILFSEWDKQADLNCGPVYTTGEAKKGFFRKITGLFTGADAADGNYEKNAMADKHPELFELYINLIPEIIEDVFEAPLTPALISAMREYLMKGDPAKPVPDGLRNAVSVLKLTNNKAYLYIEITARTYRLSPVIYRFLKVLLESDHRYEVLEFMFRIYKKDMVNELLRWRIDFSLEDCDYIKWRASQHKSIYGSGIKESQDVYDKVLHKMMKLAPDAYVEAVKTTESIIKDKLIHTAKEDVLSSFYRSRIQPILTNTKATYQEQVITQLLRGDDQAANAKAKEYLLGQCEIDTLYGLEGRLTNISRYLSLSQPLLSYVKMYGQDDFYERGATYIGYLGLTYSILGFCREKTFSVDCVKAYMEILRRRGLNIPHRLAVGIIIKEAAYTAQEKPLNTFLENYFGEDLKTNREETIQAFKESDVNGRTLAVSIYLKEFEVNKNELFYYFGDSSKQVREELVKGLQKKEELLPDLLEILKTSKKSTERETAIMVLVNYKKTAGHLEELKELLSTEKSKKVNDLIREYLRKLNGEDGNASEDGADAGEGGRPAVTVQSYIQECLKGGKKRSLAWIYENPMPEVHMAKMENDAVSEEYMQAILISYSGMPTPGVNGEVRILTDQLDQDELNLFMEELFERFLSAGAEAKRKWVLYAASIHGGSRIVPTLKHQIDEWAANSRGAIAAEAVKALSVNSSPTALLIVDGMARKYKFKQVRKAAQDAMAFAAAQLGLTVEELADRIVPDLGFDEKLERHFDYGTRSFTVKISPDLDIEVKDQTGKKIKTLPAVGKNDDEAKATKALEEFKELKKQMKTVVKNQAQRLDLAMSLNRRWTVENWKKLFVQNPVMHQFAMSLIWGHYVKNELIGIFRYMEDGTFNTVDEEEYELSEEGLIGLIHPIELEKETISAWKEQLSDYEIKQSIEQLDRPVFTMTEEEKGMKCIERFGGKMLNGLSLAGKLTGLGWSKGTPEDGGVYWLFYRKDTDAGLGVELYFSGSYIGDENDEVTVYDARCFTLADMSDFGYYDRSRESKSLPLSRIPERYFSEVIYQLTKATASSEETDENWRKKK